MYRVLLRRFTGLLLLALLGIAVYPFYSSLLPSERSIAALPRVKLPSIGPGEFAVLDDPFSTTQWPSKLLVTRQKNGELFVWAIPTRNGSFVMPDIHWWRPGITCSSFAPDFSKKVIACTEKDLSAWWKDNLRWGITGKNLTGALDDMPRVYGTESLGEFVFSMRRG